MRVGSLVECIGSKEADTTDQKATKAAAEAAGYAYPKVGEVYTVREVRTIKRPCILLEEIVNPPVDTEYGILEIAFWMSCFRELQPPMDLSEVTELLKPNVFTVISKDLNDLKTLLNP